MDPSKETTAEVFRVLKQDKANQVCAVLVLVKLLLSLSSAAMLGLQDASADVVQRELRNLYLPRLFVCAQEYGRTHHLCQVMLRRSYVSGLLTND